MYDFYFGTKEEIKSNPEEFLIFCKRLLPRWINGIPDTECLAIYRSLNQIKSDQPIVIETGCGASTLAFFLYSALNNGKLYSWDTNGSKGHFLRSVISESMCAPLGVDLHNIWTFIGFDSTSNYAGIPILSELGHKADYGFFDSWHTLNHLMNEVSCFETIVKPTFFVALDDAYYTKRFENFSFINMIRKKHGLGSVIEPVENLCEPFYEAVNEYLKNKYPSVEKLVDTYKAEYMDDIFFKYYVGDRKAMAKVGMEEKKNLEHRFDIWRVNA
jgi:hypothetical protein